LNAIFGIYKIEIFDLFIYLFSIGFFSAEGKGEFSVIKNF